MNNQSQMKETIANDTVRKAHGNRYGNIDIKAAHPELMLLKHSVESSPTMPYYRLPTRNSAWLWKTKT